MQQTDTLRAQIGSLCRELGLLPPGFFVLPQPHGGMGWGVSLAAPLSAAVVREVAQAGSPTHSYFHHYRTVNAYLDSAMLRVGLVLAQQGYGYLPVGASQSIPTESDPHGYHGRLPHKLGACLAGLGCMGSSGLFLHRQVGPRVRLGTVLTDCPLCLQNPEPVPNTSCAGCMRCRDICPAGAIAGKLYTPDMPEFALVDPARCSTHMKSAYQKIGRGAVCGLCIAVCPMGAASPPPCAE